MDARLSPPSARRRGPWCVRPWTLAVYGLLLAAGALTQACSDNNGTSGPTHTAGSPAPTTGFANTAADIVVAVATNPNSITPGQRSGITAFVTNKNGQPLAGKLVQFSTDVGSLDVVSGTTNSAGQFSTTLRISTTDAAAGKTFATVTAFVEGASGQGIVNFSGNPVLVLIPESTIQSVAASFDASGDGVADTCPAGSLGGFTINFTVSGGVPPYRFTTAGFLGTISSGGTYTVPLLGAFSAPSNVQDVVTVIDALGVSDTSTVRVECVTPTT